VAGTLTYRHLAAYMRSNFPAERGNRKKHICPTELAICMGFAKEPFHRFWSPIAMEDMVRLNIACPPRCGQAPYRGIRTAHSSDACLPEVIEDLGRPVLLCAEQRFGQEHRSSVDRME